MGRSPRPLLVDFLNPALWIFFAFYFSGAIGRIRKDIGFPENHMCRNTVQGRYLLSDDNGFVCSAMTVDSWSRCCPEKGEKFSCQGCNLVSKCCNSYEYCVSCCLSPSKTQKDLALKIHENAYASEFHHCFSLHSNSSGSMDLNSAARLAGIDVIIGKPGESCNGVCSSKGLSCVPSKLSLLNKCDVLQKYMRCNGGCFASIGSDQPAEVLEDAPKHANPGACLFTQREALLLSCDGSHQHTKRLCPCA